MTDFTLHTAESAPGDAGEHLRMAQAGFGFAPNLLRIMADAPAVSGAYLMLHEKFSSTSLTPMEQQVVLLSVSYENTCEYCMAAHTGGAMKAGMDETTLGALRSGAPLADPKLEALRTFTRHIVQERGFASESAIAAFLSFGYSRSSILEVVLGVTMKTLSNYTNHVAKTPLDDELSPLAWTKSEAVTV